MRRTQTQRAFALLFAVWFTLVGYKPGGLGACPFHDGMSAAHGGAHGAAAPQAGHDMHAAHAGHVMPAATPSSGEQRAPDHKAHQCTCAGSCSSATAVELPRTPQFVVRVTETTAAPHAVTTDVRNARVDLTLPFATAPPSVRSV